MDKTQQLRLSLWENGYRPVAVRTQSKKPFGDNWLELAMKDPPYAVTDPVRDIALSTGILCAGLRAIDIDIDDKEMADDVEKVAFEVFGDTIVRIRHGSSRRLCLYKCECEQAPKRVLEFEGGGAIEVLGSKQKFIAFGLHEEGMLYQWRRRFLTQEHPPSPLTIPADQLMGISEDQVDGFLERCGKLYPVKKKPVRPDPVISFSSEPLIEGRGRQYALSILGGVSNDLSSLTKGGRNNALNNAAMRFGSLHARGWLRLDECQAALKSACDQNGLMKEDGITEFMKTFKSGWLAGIERPASDPVNRVYETPTFDISPSTSTSLIQVVEDHTQDVTPLNDSLTYPPGLLGDLTTWIAESGPTGSRRLALSAALALVSMLLGRNISTPTRGSLEVYVLSTYPTGGGKKHQEDAINSIVDRLRLGHHMGVCSFKSGAFVEEMIKTKPLCLSIQDEFGQILGQITDAKASMHVAEIGVCFRKLFGMNFGIYRSGGALSRESGETHAAHLSLYGMTTNSQLFKSIKGKDIANGIVNRFMLIDGGDKRETNDDPNKPDVNNPPPQLLQDLYKLYYIGAPKTGNLSGHWNKNGLIKPEIYTVRWKDDDVREEYLKFKNECLGMLDRDADIGEIFARTAFYAIKIATLAACCDDPVRPAISMENLKWGSQLAMESANRFYAEIKNNMVDNLDYFELSKKIEQVLRWAPNHMMQRRKLWDKVRNYCGRNASDFSNCLKELEKNEVIEFGKDGKMSIIRLFKK